MSRLLMVAAVGAFATQGSLADPSVNGIVSELTRDIQEATRGPRAEILILGTFHFSDQGLDEYKPEHSLDIFAPERQREIEDIASRLANFRPTRVAVERHPEMDASLREQYSAYRAGTWDLTANELHQIGFRVAAAMDHTQVYPVDAPGRAYEPSVDLSAFAAANNLRHLQRTPYHSLYTKLWRELDALKMEHPLRKHLLVLNHPEMLRVQHGVYLQRSTAISANGEYPGVDGFVTQWYNRNLRIFGNIQRLLEEDEERVLVIFGAGHVPILRHLVESAPGMTLVDVSEYL